MGASNIDYSACTLAQNGMRFCWVQLLEGTVLHFPDQMIFTFNSSQMTKPAQEQYKYEIG